MASRHGTIRIGIGGWSFEPWRGSFYPERLPQRRELDYAASRLGSIEINATYYGSQRPASFAKWRDETPDGFVFAVKGPRFATNRRNLAEAGPSIEKFFSSGVLELGDKLGPINWQFMATKKFDPNDFAAFLDLLPARLNGRPIRHAVEVRHSSFLDAAFIALAGERGIAIVLAGDGPYPLIEEQTASFVYARIMGTRTGEPLGYAPAELDMWAARARAWAEGKAFVGLEPLASPPPHPPRDVFLYVIAGEKARNPAAAEALIERLGKPVVET